jgi:hypothetical protein
MQEMIAEGYLKRVGHGTFIGTGKVMPKSVRTASARR